MKYNLKHFNDLSTSELYTLIRERIKVFIIEQNCLYEECDNHDQGAWHLMVMDKEELAGCLRILPAGLAYETVSIGRVVVKKEYRGQGIARIMMQTAMQFVEQELKETAITISAQAYLKDFYESLGFYQLTECYDEDGIPHIKMIYVFYKPN
jgi:ElaA protein